MWDGSDSAPIVGPVRIAIALMIAFSSSRTLPGHMYATSASSADRDKLSSASPPCFCRKRAASVGRSSRRSRNGRNPEHDDIEAIEQILAKQAALDRLAQIDV